MASYGKYFTGFQGVSSQAKLARLIITNVGTLKEFYSHDRINMTKILKHDQNYDKQACANLTLPSAYFDYANLETMSRQQNYNA